MHPKYLITAFAIMSLMTLAACDESDHEKGAVAPSYSSESSSVNSSKKDGVVVDQPLGMDDVTVIELTHGDTPPTQEELEKYQWYSQGSANFASFNGGELKIFSWRKSDNGTYHRLEISNFPYEIIDNVMQWDVVIRGKKYVGVDDTFVMSWEGNELVLTPQDDQPEKGHRSHRFVPIEYKYSKRIVWQ